jgi:PTS system mannitol-specific IIA component
MWFKKATPAPTPAPLLTVDDVIPNASATDKWEAIRLVGQRLVAAGHVGPEYLDAMVQRENEFTTYIGNGLAIPHGVGAAKEQIRSSGLSIAQFPNGLDFGGGNTAYLVIGIAGKGDEHLEILSNIAMRCESPEAVRQLAQETDRERLIRAFL